MRKLYVLLCAATIAGASAIAHAESVEPISLSEAELDGVTAGISFLFADSDADAFAGGEGAFVLNFSATETEAFAVTNGFDFEGFSSSSSESASF